MFWLGAIVSLCYVPGLTGAYIATQWPVLAVLLSFALIRSGSFTAMHAAGLAFIAYAVVRIPFSPAPDASVFGVWLVIIMGLCVRFGSTMTSMKELYAGLAVGAGVSSFLAVLQHFGFDSVQTVTTPSAGLYVNSVQQGAVLALVAVALVSERMWAWVIPIIPGIALAQSRGAWIILAVGLLGCYVRRLWMLGVVAVPGAYFLLHSLSSSDTQRMFIWHAAWDNLTWLGWGPGVFYTIILAPDGAVPFFPEYAHNDFLQLLFEYGVAALIPFAILGCALYRTNAREWPVVLAFVTAACFSMPLFMPITSFLGLVAVGRILRTYDVGGTYGSRSRQSVVSWFDGQGRKAVPVAPHLAAEG